MEESKSFSRAISKQEISQLMTMFPQIQVDMSQFKVLYEEYPMLSKTTLDTRSDN